MKVIPRTHVKGQKAYSDYDNVNLEQNVFGVIPVCTLKMERR